MPNVSPGTSTFPWSESRDVCSKNACCIISITRNAGLGARIRSTEAMSVSHSGMAPYCDMASVPRIRYSQPCLVCRSSAGRIDAHPHQAWLRDLAVIVEIVASIWQSFVRLFEFTAGDVVRTSVTTSLSPFLAAYEGRIPPLPAVMSQRGRRACHRRDHAPDNAGNAMPRPPAVCRPAIAG